MIRAVCFDLDGTLGGYAGDFQAFLALLRSELLLQACDMNDFARIMREELARDGPLRLETVLRRTLARLEQRAPVDLAELAEAALGAYAEEVRPAAGAERMLQRLERRGVPLAIVSNGPVDMQRAALRALGFERFFRTVVISGDPAVGCRKPAPRIFALACSGLQVPPDEVLMVGDSLEADIRGALDHGMQAVLVGPDALGARLDVPAVGGVEPLDALLRERYGL